MHKRIIWKLNNILDLIASSWIYGVFLCLLWWREFSHWILSAFFTIMLISFFLQIFGVYVMCWFAVWKLHSFLSVRCLVYILYTLVSLLAMRHRFLLRYIAFTHVEILEQLCSQAACFFSFLSYFYLKIANESRWTAFYQYIYRCCFF